MSARQLDKHAFFTDLGYTPHEGQREVHNSLAPRRVVACGVRWGKTVCAAMEGLAAAMQPAERSMGWVVAPTYDLADKVFREIAIYAAQHLHHRVITLKENDRKLVIRNMAGGISEIRGKSADNPVSLLGEGLDWLIVDEAARLKPRIWEAHLSQRLIDKKGWALLISTPKGKGVLHDLFRRGQGKDPEYESWNQPSWVNPILDRALIEKERDRLPQRVFDQEYGGAFLEGAGAVFRNVRECATGELQEPKPHMQYYAGLDLAKVEDFTVLTIVNRYLEVVYVDRFHRLDWSVQIQRVKAAVDRYNFAPMWVDSTGVGEPVYEAIVGAGCRVAPYTLTARSKAALINNLSLRFERKQITLPRYELWPEGIDELEGFEFTVTDAGNTKMSAPPGTHDDCVISLALAIWIPSPRLRVAWKPIDDGRPRRLRRPVR